MFDPNVLVAAAITPDGACAEALRTARAARLEIVVSERLLDELVRVLARPKFRRYLRLYDATDFVDSLREHARFCADPQPAFGATRDPGDDYLVALAQAAQADAIVSGDDDLLTAGISPPAMRPRELLSRLAGAG